MTVASPYAELVGQHVVSMLVFEPWRDLIPGEHGPVAPAIFGAVILLFDRAALICTSPLRYLRTRNGTVVSALAGEPVNLGYRATLCDRDGVESLLPMTFSLSDSTARWQTWLDTEHPLIGAKALGMTVAGEGGEGSVIQSGIELTLDLHPPLRISYRQDLDGGIELAEPGEHLRISQIVVLSPEDDFGWLHPAAPLDFILDDHLWQSAKVDDWPASLRRALGRSKEPNAFYHRTLTRALRARFGQRPMHLQRLLALRYPVHCSDVPDGLIEEVAADLRKAGLTAMNLLRPLDCLG